MIKLNEILTEARGTCWKGYEQVGMKDKGGKEVPNCVPESIVKEATTSSAPGEWVAYLSMPRGKKLLKTFNTARGAKQFLSKNVDKLLSGSNVESVGLMTKKQWDTTESKYAIEGITEATFSVNAKNPYEFTNGAYAVLNRYLQTEPLGVRGKKELQNIVKSLEYMRKYFYSNMTESNCDDDLTESEYKFGKVEYTIKPMKPTEIQNLALAYNQASMGTLTGNNIDHRIRTRRDIARLVGRSVTNPTEKSKEGALLLLLLKNKLVSEDDYRELYKSLLDKLMRVFKSVKNADPSTRNTIAADKMVARAAAMADMRREF